MKTQEEWNPMRFFLNRVSSVGLPKIIKPYPVPVCACRNVSKLVLSIVTPEEKENKWLKALKKQCVYLCQRKGNSISQDYLNGQTGFGIPNANEIWILGTERKRGKIQTICAFALLQYKMDTPAYLYLDVLSSRPLTGYG